MQARMPEPERFDVFIVRQDDGSIIEQWCIGTTLHMARVCASSFNKEARRIGKRKLAVIVLHGVVPVVANCLS